MAANREPDLRRHTATLYTLAQIMDVGNTLLRLSGASARSYGLPRTYEEYIQRLYGPPTRNWMLVLNYGFLASLIALGVAVLMLISYGS